MALYVNKTDWSKCQPVPVRVNEAVATEVLNYLFNTNTWKTNPDALIVKLRQWRTKLWAVEDAPAPALALVVDEPQHWTDVAVRMRREGASWNQIKARVNMPISTIRDTVKRAAA